MKERIPTRRFGVTVSRLLSNRLLLVAAGLCAATIGLVWFGFQATRTSALHAQELLRQRAREQAALLSAGLNLDMKAAFATVISTVTPAQLVREPPYDLADAFARGFARFSYPESFFVWKDSAAGGVTYVFTRADRRPRWLHHEPLGDVPYPVGVSRDVVAINELVAEARRHALYNRPLTLFRSTIDTTPYQVVVSFLYRSDDSDRLLGLVGFLVNLDWVRHAYFGDVALQVARIGGAPNDVRLEVLDNANRLVASTPGQSGNGTIAERSFSLAFIDSILVNSGTSSPNQEVETWMARASVSDTSTLAAVAAGTDLSLEVISIAALAAVVGLVVTVRGVGLASELAAMRSNFVSSVTHELKTPLTAILLTADTLVRNRANSREVIDDYAKLLSKESRNLLRVVDNLLAYARLSDKRDAYAFELVDVSELVDNALEHYQPILSERQFTTNVQLSPSLPLVRADRTALSLVIENLIDNAIKYSRDSRVIWIRACPAGGRISVSVTDDGIGIRDDELGRVCEKFFRGRGVNVSGSGIGLAIVRDIIQAHAGSLVIASKPGEGTRVEVLLPVVVESC